MKDVIGKYNSSLSDGSKPELSSTAMQIETQATPTSKKEETNHKIRSLNVEDLEGLTLNELVQLEKILQNGLCHVLERKGPKLLEEDALFRQKVMEMYEGEKIVSVLSHTSHDDKESSSSITATNSEYPQDFGDSSDTLLKLGQPFN